MSLSDTAMGEGRRTLAALFACGSERACHDACADVLVTGDRHLLALTIPGLRIARPAEIVDESD